MKNCLLLGLCVGAVWWSGCGPVSTSPAPLDLNEGWTFLGSNGTWLPAEVPGNVHMDLVRNGEITDPFLGTQEDSVQWVERREWRYRRVLNAPRGDGNWVLEFLGLDTYATVMLNGDTLLLADNMHRSWRIPLSEMVFTGDDVLDVVFASPVLRGQQALDAHPWKIPVSNEARPQGEQVSAVVRKAMYHFGWDWGPRLVTSGIWKPVRWVNAAKELPSYRLNLEALTADTARYEVVFDAPVRDLGVTLTLEGVPVPVDWQSRGENSYGLTLVNPQLWWPNGMGDQPLYDVVFRDGEGREATQRLGVRTLNWAQVLDKFGRSFQCEVNGAPVQARGANVIPADFFLNRASEKVDRLIQHAVDANMNMLRVWGGAVYGSEAFYDRCDEEGLLVWQDFMSACAMVPDDPAWQAHFFEEAREQVKRLRNRTSLALWCGNNETEKAWKEWGWQELYGLDVADSTAAWDAYLAVFDTGLTDIVRELEGGFYWPSSPHPVDEASHRRDGDQHDWGVWFGQEDFDFFTEDAGRFASEFGLQSLPDRRTLEEVGVQSFTDRALQFRQRSKMDWLEPGFDGWDMMQFYADGYFADPKAVEAEGMDELDRWIHLTQLTQAEGLRQAIERHRCSQGRTAGSLYWQLDDVWPTVSWSTVDHAGRWKLAHHAVRHANQPVRLLWDRTRTDVLRLVGQNLGPNPWRGSMTWALLDLQGDTLRTLELKTDLTPLGGRDHPFMTSDVPEEAAVLTWLLRHESGAWSDRGATPLKRPSLYDWTDADVRVESAASGVWLECDTLVCGLRLTASEAGHFEDNGFILLPGERRWVGFVSPDGEPATPGTVQWAHLGQYRPVSGHP